MCLLRLMWENVVNCLVCYLRSGNAAANTCRGDMVFYWFRQLEVNGTISFCFGEGPKADRSELCNDSSSEKVEVSERLSNVQMYGTVSDAYFQYSMVSLFTSCLMRRSQSKTKRDAKSCSLPFESFTYIFIILDKYITRLS